MLPYYPVEKIGIRQYKYWFRGFDKPVIVEAQNKWQARHGIVAFIRANPAYVDVPIISETLSIPIIGETTKKVDNVDFVWNGDGWIPLFDYEQNNFIHDGGTI